jgi:hypothetical protein
MELLASYAMTALSPRRTRVSGIGFQLYALAP